jgi:hypothetical protein
MKKIAAYMCVMIGLVILVVSSSSSLSNRIWMWNNRHALTDAWWGKHNSKGGGLTAMAYLDDIKKFEEPKYYHFDTPADNGVKNIDLYVWGDSYTEDVPGYAFANTHAYHYKNYVNGMTYSLDTSKINILIFEVSERLLLDRYDNYSIFDRLKKQEVSEPASTSAESQPSAKGDEAPKPKTRFAFNKNFSPVINKNLEYLIFDYNFINRVRRFKADMNYQLYNRASGDVAISENGKYIFYKPTIMPNGSYSIYRPFSDEELSGLVHILDDIYEHYKKEGFTEIYFSPIPNTASVLQPEGYNGLIPRIQKNPAMKIPCFDVFTIFKNAQQPEKFFQTGDTHWNNNGMQVWLGLVNNELRKKSGGK